MPRRSNPFQRLMFLIHEKLAGEATVTESASLKDIRTGQHREVDILIETRVADSLLRIGIECTTGSRPATVEWVERMIGKHRDLPTDKLLLVSESGFTANAREKASLNMVETIGLGQALEADWTAIVNKLKTVYLGLFRFTLAQFSVTFEPAVELREGETPPLDTVVYRGDAEPRGTIRTNVDKAFADIRPAIMQQIEPGTAKTFQIVARPGEEVYIHYREGRHRIQRIQMQIKCAADTRIPVDLRAATIRDAHLAYGEVRTPEVEGIVGVIEKRKEDRTSVVTWCWDLKEIRPESKNGG
jgi:hypothetical protein